MGRQSAPSVAMPLTSAKDGNTDAHTAIAQGNIYKFRFLALIPAAAATSTIRGYAGIRLWNARTGVFRVL